MKFTTFLSASLMFLAGSANATKQCPPDVKCEPMPEEFMVAITAQIVATSNVCSRNDPARAKDYVDAVDRLMREEREDFEKAQQSKLFPAVLVAAEDELKAMHQDKLARQCERLLRK